MGTIAYHRKKAGMNQHRLANLIGTSRSTVSAWEMMQTAPTEEQIERLAELFEIKPTDLIVRAEPYFNKQRWRPAAPEKTRIPMVEQRGAEFAAGVRYALANLMTSTEALLHIHPRPSLAWFTDAVREERIGTQVSRSMRLFLPEDIVLLCYRKGWLYVEGPSENGAEE